VGVSLINDNCDNFFVVLPRVFNIIYCPSLFDQYAIKKPVAKKSA
jgi:hypothetical protein